MSWPWASASTYCTFYTIAYLYFRLYPLQITLRRVFSLFTYIYACWNPIVKHTHDKCVPKLVCPAVVKWKMVGCWSSFLNILSSVSGKRMVKRKSSSTTPPKQPQAQDEAPSSDSQVAIDQVMQLKTEPEEEPKEESMCDSTYSYIYLFDTVYLFTLLVWYSTLRYFIGFTSSKYKYLFDTVLSDTW